MSWEKTYRNKITSAAEAVKLVRSGDWVLPSHAAGEPKYLMDALLQRKDELRGVVIWQGVTLSEAEYAKKEYEKSFTLRSHFLSPNTRAGYKEGRSGYLPMPFSTVPQGIRSGKIRCDVYMGNLSLPDNDGYCSFGVSVDIARACMDTAETKIGFLNACMPRTCGDTLVHISEFDALVAGEEPLYQLEKIGGKDAVVDRIGSHIANLIEDGDTLQMGIGNMPNAILQNLAGHQDLGIHTEVFTDNLLPLIEADVITGKRKTLNPGKIVSTFIQGSEEVYRFIDKNPLVKMMPVDYTNDAGIIAQHDNMVAVNAALEVDLMGQVAADSIGSRQFSGVGGQLDFIRGAAAAKNGRAVIALPATAKAGTLSRISACLKPGTAVTTTRNDVRYVVTEFGAADLYGKTLKERAKAMIELAAPAFRADLEEEFWQVMQWTAE